MSVQNRVQGKKSRDSISYRTDPREEQTRLTHSLSNTVLAKVRSLKSESSREWGLCHPHKHIYPHPHVSPMVLSKIPVIDPGKNPNPLLETKVMSPDFYSR